MQVNQQMTTRRGARIPRPLLNVNLHVSPNFTGQVVVYVKNGCAVCDRQLTDDELVATLAGFIELARNTGWHVAPPQSDLEGGSCGTDSDTNS